MSRVPLDFVQWDRRTNNEKESGIIDLRTEKT